jgi:hypothetical protein
VTQTDPISGSPIKYGPLLTAELGAVRSELGRIDAKCSMLAGLSGAIAAFTVTQVTGQSAAVARLLFAAAGLALTTAAMILLLAVIRPRLGPVGFCRYVDLSVMQIDNLFRTGRTVPGSEPRADTLEAVDLKFMSRLAARKYCWLRRAVDLIAVGVALVAAAALLEVIAR